MLWLSYESFSILCNAFLLKSAISSHNSCMCHASSQLASQLCPDLYMIDTENFTFQQNSYLQTKLSLIVTQSKHHPSIEKLLQIHFLRSLGNKNQLLRFVYLPRCPKTACSKIRNSGLRNGEKKKYRNIKSGIVKPGILNPEHQTLNGKIRNTNSGTPNPEW